MKLLNELTLNEYIKEYHSGMFWEHYPEATGNYTKDCKVEEKKKSPMSEQYGNRTLCEIFTNMRALNKTQNYSYLPGLIEEAQYRAERMENALETYGEGWHGLIEMEKERIKLKREIKVLKKEKEFFEENHSPHKKG